MSEENYNKDSVDCVRLPYPMPPASEREIKVGEFCWGEEREDGSRYLYLKLPGEEPGWGPDAIRVTRGAAGGPMGNHTWNWDGNEDKPTLSPSLHWVGRWHGWLRAGRLVSC